MELEVEMVLLSLILHRKHSVYRQPDQNIMQVCVHMVWKTLDREGVEMVQFQKTISTNHYFDKLQVTTC